MKIFAYNDFTHDRKKFGDGWELITTKKIDKSTGKEFVSGADIGHERTWENGRKSFDIQVRYWLDDLHSIQKLRAKGRESYNLDARYSKSWLNEITIRGSDPHLLSIGVGEKEIRNSFDNIVKAVTKITGDDLSKYKEFKELVEMVINQHKMVSTEIKDSGWSDGGFSKLGTGDVIIVVKGYGSDRSVEEDCVLIEVTKPALIGNRSKISITGVILATNDVSNLGDRGDSDLKEWMGGRKKIENTLQFDQRKGDTVFLVSGGADKYGVGKSGVDRTGLELSDVQADWIWGKDEND